MYLYILAFVYIYIYIYIFIYIFIICVEDGIFGSKLFKQDLLSVIESAWAEHMGQLFDHLDPNTRKITWTLEK